MAKNAYNVTIPTGDTIPVIGVRGPYGPQAVYEEYLWEIVASGFAVNFNTDDGKVVILNKKDLYGFKSISDVLDKKGYTLPGDNYKISLKVVKTEEKSEAPVVPPKPEENKQDAPIVDTPTTKVEGEKVDKKNNHHNGNSRRDKLDKEPPKQEIK